MEGYALGFDSGTQPARALLANTKTCHTAASAVHPYAEGVIESALPGSDVPLPPDWALQDPADSLSALHKIVPSVLAKSGVTGEAVIKIRLDFTACTVLPTTAKSAPLCLVTGYAAVRTRGRNSGNTTPPNLRRTG